MRSIEMRVETLRQIRRLLNIPAKAAAMDLNVSLQALYDYEKGARKLPIDLIIPMAELYDIEIEDIVRAALATVRG